MKLNQEQIDTMSARQLNELCGYDGPRFDASGEQLSIKECKEREAAAGRRSRPRPLPSSPASNTGGKLTDPQSKHTVCLDWVRMSGPRSTRSQAVSLLAGYFGNPTCGKGRFFLSTGYHFGSVAVLFDNDEGEGVKDHCIIEIPGAALSEISFEDTVEIIDRLMSLGYRICRLDIACDIYDQPCLIDEMIDSCMAGELCAARKFEPKHVQSCGSVVGHGCNVGDRGSKNGSGRYLRVYDKGLEQKQDVQGRWVRWEAELSHECGHEAALSIINSENMAGTALSFAFGVCDFREKTGSQHLDRRKRSKWYADLLREVCPQRITKTRAKSSLHSFKRWMRSSVVPRLEILAAATGYAMGELINMLFDPAEPDSELLEDPKVRALCIEAGTDPSAAMYRLGNRRLVMVTAGGG